MDNKVVIDTSVIIKWLNKVNEDNIEEADQVMNSTLKGKIELFAPELARYEIGNVLLKGKQLSLDQAYISLATVYSLPINFITESEELARETYSLASELNITYYDASFMSLAKYYDAILLTENVKHQGKSTQLKVKSLKDY